MTSFVEGVCTEGCSFVAITPYTVTEQVPQYHFRPPFIKWVVPSALETGKQLPATTYRVTRSHEECGSLGLLVSSLVTGCYSCAKPRMPSRIQTEPLASGSSVLLGRRPQHFRRNSTPRMPSAARLKAKNPYLRQSDEIRHSFYG